MSTQLVVTEKNVNFISDDNLLHRYQKLKRTFDKGPLLDHLDVVNDLNKELEVVKKALISRGYINEVCEQIEMGINPKPKKQEYEPIVIEILRQYGIKKELLKRKKLQLKQGFELVFPNNISSIYHNKSGVLGGYSEYQSSSEKAVIQLEEKREALISDIAALESEIKMVEYCIETLSEDEKSVIKYKYLQKPKKSDQFIIDQIKVSRSIFYEIRNRAIKSLAEAFRII